jgi:hypothetical protein
LRAYPTRSCNGSPVDLDAVADELYGLSLGEFTAARDARAAEARRAGDRGLASAIKTLRRPTKVAWLANVLVRRHREQVDALFRLGEAMQDAQDQLAGEELRQLSRRRQEVVSALTREARRIASDAGDPVSDEVARELTATLEAALADPAARAEVNAGRLTAALSYSGFGSLDPDPAVSATRRRAGGRTPAGQPAEPRRQVRPDRQGRQAAEILSAERSLSVAEADAAAAARDAKDAAGRAALAADEAARLDRQVSELEVELARLRPAAAGAGEELSRARRARDAVVRKLRDANRRLAAAQKNLDRLRPP